MLLDWRLAALSLALFNVHPTIAAEEKLSRPCTVHSPNTGNFFDLSTITLSPPKNPKKLQKGERADSWHARGHDYPTNFTLNICAPVVEDLDDVVGVERKNWRNVSAFYKQGGKIYSLGQESSEPIFRGRKLVLNYTNGSPCDTTGTLSHTVDSISLPKGTNNIESRKYIDDDDDDEPKNGGSGGKAQGVRRKSTLISFLCESDPLSAQAALSFVGASPDECAYFFEVRTPAACAVADVAQQTLGPGAVFGVIAAIALLVYFIGGCVYQRTVMHQRGWRQLPNAQTWAGIGGFFKDIFIILTSSCGRLIPGRRGYSRVAPFGRGRTGSNPSDDENRLIDQLDEEWED